MAERDKDELADALASLSAQPVRPAGPVRGKSSAADDSGFRARPAQPAAAVPPTPQTHAKSPIRSQHLTFRRTMIPILLTMGVALPGCAIWWWTLDAESPLKELGLKFPVTLGAVGIVSLGLAILNMLQVRSQLAARS